MFAAHARLHLPPVELDLDVGLDSRFRVAVVRHQAAIWDTRFVPPNWGEADHHVVYLVLDGELCWIEPAALRVGALGGFVSPSGPYEGARGRRLGRLRATGAPFLGVELHVASRDVAAAPHLPMVIAPSASSLAAAHAFAGRVLDAAPLGPAQRDPLVAALLQSLLSDGILRTDLARTMRHVEGIEALLWSAFVPNIERVLLGTSLGAIADQTRLSLRQLDRVMARFLRHFALPWSGWRGLMRNYRLKAAILLLSCPELRITEIAERCGYSSTEALAHALSTEGLASPAELRRRIVAG